MSNKKTSRTMPDLFQQAATGAQEAPNLPAPAQHPGDTPSNPMTPTQLNRLARAAVENHFGRVWISGEVTGFTRHAASGHCYFTLKDKHASVSCAWFRRQIRPGQSIRNGDSVLVFGQISIYEARGAFQVIVQQVEGSGQGDLHRQYLALKKRLEELGLFDRRFKKSIPAHPRRIAIVTSKSGAAVQDVLKTIARRNPLLEIRIFHASVQGDNAPETLITALEQADTGGFDAILLTRGGGSLEDLWAFNDEGLAHTIFTLKTPLVSAVGHERDFTIADEVADARAATPTAGAELLSPDLHVTRVHLQHAKKQLLHLAERQLQNAAQTLDGAESRLYRNHPLHYLARQTQSVHHYQHTLQHLAERQLQHAAQALDATENRLHRNHPLHHLARQTQSVRHYQHTLQHWIRHHVAELAGRLNSCHHQVQLAHPARRLTRAGGQLDKLTDRLIGAVLSRLRQGHENTRTLLQRLWRQQPALSTRRQHLTHLQARLARSGRTRLVQKHAQLQGASGLLERLSPLKVLQRGYSITQRDDSGVTVTRASQVRPGDILHTRLSEGAIVSQVINTSPKNDSSRNKKTPSRTN